MNPPHPPTPPTPPRFLVTAGNTRERIDRVRDWGNIFTGNTGLSIARALSIAGEVDLLTSNRSHLEELSRPGAAPPAAAAPTGTVHPVRASGFESHEHLKGALAALMARETYAAVFMTAAVADYRPAGVYEIVERTARADDGLERWVVRGVQSGKVKSNYRAIAVAGEPTEKLIDLFRADWAYRGLLVKFKLEVGVTPDELLRVGEASRRASGADYLVANSLDMVQGPGAGAFLLSDVGHEWVPRAQLPQRMLRLVRP